MQDFFTRVRNDVGRISCSIVDLPAEIRRGLRVSRRAVQVNQVPRLVFLLHIGKIKSFLEAWGGRATQNFQGGGGGSLTLISPCMKGGCEGADKTNKSPKSEAVENMGASVLTLK